MNKLFTIISIILIGGCSTVAGVGKDVTDAAEWSKKKFQSKWKIRNNLIFSFKSNIILILWLIKRLIIFSFVYLFQLLIQPLPYQHLFVCLKLHLF